MKKVLLIVLASFISFNLFVGQSVFAQEQEVVLKEQKINPGTVSYPVKRLWEKFREKLLGSDKDKVNYYGDLTKTRLAELKYVTDNKLIGEVQTTSERFAYYAGLLTDNAEKLNDGDKKTQIKKEFASYKKTLEGLRDKFDYGGSYWMLIEHSINSLNLYTERLNK